MTKMDKRKALKTIIAGGVATSVAIPSVWKKPVVNSVMLPAHAQATGPTTGNGFNVPGNIVMNVLDSIIPTANAGLLDEMEELPPLLPGFLCIEEDDGPSVVKASYTFSGGALLTGFGSVGSCITLRPCSGDLPGLDLLVSNNNGDNSFDFELHPEFSNCGSDSMSEPYVTETTNIVCTVPECMSQQQPE